MIKANNIEELSRDQLIELCKIYAKNWIAHDGCWFLALENKYGMETAIEMDTAAWKHFTVIEAKRVKKFLDLPEKSGIEGLKKAFHFRLYATLNKIEFIKEDENTLIFHTKTCRVQSARRRKGLTDFPCKSIGLVEFGLFAKTIDDRFEMEVISCPPDVTNEDYYCIWKFTLNE